MMNNTIQKCGVDIWNTVRTCLGVHATTSTRQSSLERFLSKSVTTKEGENIGYLLITSPKYPAKKSRVITIFNKGFFAKSYYVYFF